jgi:hypothetical protein
MTWFSQFHSQDVSEQFLSQDLSPPATRSLASTDFPVGLEQLLFEDEQGHSVTRCSPPSSPLKLWSARMLYFPWMEMVNCPGTSMACLTLAFLWMRRGTQSFNLSVGNGMTDTISSTEPLPKAAILHCLRRDDRKIGIRECVPSHLQTMVTSPVRLSHTLTSIVELAVPSVTQQQI